jgi:hypothetical protein
MIDLLSTLRVEPDLVRPFHYMLSGVSLSHFELDQAAWRITPRILPFRLVLGILDGGQAA